MKRVRVDGELGDVVTDLILDDADVTAQRLLDTDNHKRVKSTNASSYVAGTANQITVTGASGGVTVSLPSVIVPPATNTTSYLQFNNNNSTSMAIMSQADVLSQVALTNPTACYIQMTAPSSRVLASSAVSLETVGASSNASVISGSSGAVLLKRGSTTDVQSNSSALALSHGTTITATSPDVRLKGSSLVVLELGGANRFVSDSNSNTMAVATDNYYNAITATGASARNVIASSGSGAFTRIDAEGGERIKVEANDITVNAAASGFVKFQQNTATRFEIMTSGIINMTPASGAYIALNGPTFFQSAAADPTALSEGQFYYNYTTHTLKYYDGSTWKTVTAT